MCHSVPDSFLVRIASIEYVHIHRSYHLKLLKLHVIRSHFITFPTPTTQNYKIGGYIYKYMHGLSKTLSKFCWEMGRGGGWKMSQWDKKWLEHLFIDFGLKHHTHFVRHGLVVLELSVNNQTTKSQCQTDYTAYSVFISM